MKKMLRNTLLAGLVAISALALNACKPDAAQVALITNACNADAAIRPSINLLLVLATPVQAQAVQAARLVIDPVCANPSADVETNVILAFNAAVAKVLEVKGQLDDAVKASGAPPAK